MDLLPLIDPAKEQRSTPYYNKYKYRVKFKIDSANRSYNCYTIAEFVESMERIRRRGWITEDVFNSTDYAEVEKFLDVKRKYYVRGRKDNKIMVVTDYYDWVKIFTNDVYIVNEITRLRFKEVTVTEAEISINPGIMLFKNPPKHRYRIYLKGKKIDPEFKQRFLEFLAQYPDINPCRSLKDFLSNPFFNRPWRDSWLRASHFIEYDEPGLHTVLLLYFGNSIFGKHFELQQIK